METWLRISLLLCLFGFFREMRPSEPYALQYVTGQFNVTSEIISKKMLPISTYSVLPQLVIIFLITDMLRYKPIIITSAVAGSIVFGIAIWSHDITLLLVSQILYGNMLASEVAYYTYIYAKVERDRYQIVTGHTRGAILCGKFLGGALGQLLLSTKTMSIADMFYISFSTQLISFVIAIALPKVGKSLYFYADQKKVEVETRNEGTQHSIAVISASTASVTTATDSMYALAPEKMEKTVKPQFSLRNAARLLLQQTVSAYSKPIVVKWSIWWALATCGQVQVYTYIQMLWEEIDPEHEYSYNGAVEATLTLLGAAAAMAAGYMNGSRHKKWHWWILIACSLTMGIFVIISALTNSIILCYAMYILFGVTYYFVITIASATVAENLCDDSFGLIFGINTLFALVLQSVLTVVVVSDDGLGYGPHDQYLVYGGFFIVLAAIYCLVIVMKFIMKYRHKAKYILK